MKRIIHFFEIAVIAVRIAVAGDTAGKNLFSNIRPVL